MLTLHSLTLSRIRVLLLALVLVVAISITGFSQKPEQKNIIKNFNGNQFEIYPGYRDTTVIVDSFTGSEKFLVTHREPYPIIMNGNKIYFSNELNNKVTFPSKDSSFEEYLTEQIAPDLVKLPDVHYYLELINIVIDEKGKLAYYEFNGINRREYSDYKLDPIPLELKNEIDIRIKNTLNIIVVNPGQYQNTNVPSLHYYYGLGNSIEIKDHIIVTQR